MTKLINRRMITAALVAVMLVATVTACNSGSNDNHAAGGTNTPTNTSQETKEEPSKPIPLSIFRMGMDQDPKSDPILLELQARTNTQLTFITAPWDQYVNKMNLMMASGEKVDIILADRGGNPWRQWAEEGMLLELDPYLSREKYPFLDSVVNSVSFASYKVNGKGYVLPGIHHGADWSFYMRQDWLEKLNLSVPKTLDDFYNVLVAFKEQDPDGNGVDDTYGLISAKLDSMWPIFRAYGSSFHAGNMGLEVKNGIVGTTIVNDGSKEALKYVNRLYRERLINPDLATITDLDNQWLYTGKGGSLWCPAGSVNPDQVALIPGGDAMFAAIDPMTQAGYDLWYEYGPSYWLVYAVTSSCKHPEKALEVMEYVNSYEGKELLICGIKGKHYTQLSEDGVFDRDKEGWSQDYDTSNGDYNTPFWVAFFSTCYGYLPASKYDTFEEAYVNETIFRTTEEEKFGFSYKTAIEDGLKWITSEANPLATLALEDTEVLTIQAAIHDEIETSFMKAVFSENPEDIDAIWDEFIAKVESLGFDKMIAAYQSYYDNNLK